MKYIISPTLVFPIEVLQNRCFYINETYNGGIDDTTIYFKKNSFIEDINSVLKKKIEESKNYVYRRFKDRNIRIKNPRYINFYPEILFKQKLAIKDATHFVIPQHILTENTKKFLQKHYSNLQIVLRENDNNQYHPRNKKK